jgi:hypothetical protein
MATRIALKGGESILVAEDLDVVVTALGGNQPLPAFTRTAGYSDPGTVEGQPIHVRPASVAYVTTV